MADTPIISIVVPCFNDGQYLVYAVESALLCLAEIPGELIVVNDGSDNPETIKILEDLERRGISIIHQENKGVMAARNVGIRKAKGEFILPLDSDNEVMPSFLLEALEIFRANPEVDIVYPDLEFMGDKSGVMQVPDFDLTALLVTNYVDTCALYRKSLWEELGGYDELMPVMGWEDWDLWLRAANAGARFYHIPAPGFRYRVRSGSVIQTTKHYQKELVKYIFSKPKLHMAALARQKHFEAVIANRVYHSAEYRAGRALLYPFRQIQRWFR